MINKNDSILFFPVIRDRVYDNCYIDIELELESKLYDLLALNILSSIDIPIRNSVENNDR
jgi:hypothetical protein